MNTAMASNTEASIVNAPLTPPTEAKRMEPRKLSVTFDLSKLPQTPRENDHTLLSPSLSSPNSLDICGHAVPDSILVALLNRDEEMRHLVAHNHAFFAALRSHLHTAWPRFENTLYCPRSQMDDCDWMKRISKALQAAPVLLDKFKELVGYLDEDDREESTGWSDYFPVDITRIRDYPLRLEAFDKSYPQFFINCEQYMGQSLLDRFRHILYTPRHALPDDLWEHAVYDHLDQWPNLVDQLKEIIDYEVECGLEESTS